MDRRKFIQQTALLSIGGLLLPSALLSSCRPDTLFEGPSFQGKVLIIGAGAAGLYAGYILKSKGIDFQILEASPSYGGRLGKLTGFANFPIDTGAQWMHGKNSIVGDLVKKSDTPITLDDSNEKYWFNNELVSSLPRDINEIFLDDYAAPDVSFAEFAIQKGFGNEYKNIVEAIAGDSGADASNISAYWKIMEEENWSAGDEDFKFEETFFDFIEKEIAIQVQDQIQLNTVIKQIDYTGPIINVTDSNDNAYTADKVIITVPITILKSGDIEFVPALPTEKTNAFSKIGMDAGMKVFLKFNTKFFDENVYGGSICAAYADDSIGKVQDDNILLAFIMGQQAEYLTSLGSDAAITNALIQELDAIYNGQASASFVASHVQNWTTNPFVRGAYSYSTIGMGDARKVASETVAKKLYFAGEAMNTNGHHQTVHGAIETGYREVINLITDVRK
jgi:lysine-specific histone demethylase 1B